MIRATNKDDLKIGYFVKTTDVRDTVKTIPWNGLADKIVSKLNTYADAEEIVPYLKNWYNGYRNSRGGEDVQSSGIGIAFIFQALGVFFNVHRNGQLNNEILNLRNQILPMPEIQNENEDQNARGAEAEGVDEFGNA